MTSMETVTLFTWDIVHSSIYVSTLSRLNVLREQIASSFYEAQTEEFSLEVEELLP